MGLAVTLAAASVATAQDIRVYTTVHRMASGTPDSPVIAESLTLFHAGKVYDYMDRLGEVVIFEPGQHRFTILGADYMATTVSFVEIQQFLKASRQEADTMLASPSSDSRGRRVEAGLRCQFFPEFQTNIGVDRLTMQSERLTYDVQTAAAPNEGALKAYLDYADWAARLNYILHPQALYPEPRLAVNEALRKQQKLPVQVDLAAKLDSEMHLRAQHKFGWELQPIDRQFIDQWERRRESESLRWVSVHEYQKQLLAKSTSR